MPMADLLAALRANLAQTDITLYAGASPCLIRRFERQLNLTLPEDFREFYRCCDGFESAEDLFRMVPLDEIRTHPGNYEPRRYPRVITIAEYLIYCDMWYVELLPGAAGPAYQIFHEHKGRKVVLTDSLASFLQRFLAGGVFEAGGLYSWSEELNID
jgi:cell wall assembly regulator SMI1